MEKQVQQVVDIMTVEEKDWLAETWIAYTLSEGEEFRMLGGTEEQTDEAIKLFKETGKMVNPMYNAIYPGSVPEYLAPNSMMKLTVNGMYYNLLK